MASSKPSVDANLDVFKHIIDLGILSYIRCFDGVEYLFVMNRGWLFFKRNCEE